MLTKRHEPVKKRRRLRRSISSTYYTALYKHTHHEVMKPSYAVVFAVDLLLPPGEAPGNCPGSAFVYAATASLESLSMLGSFVPCE